MLRDVWLFVRALWKQWRIVLTGSSLIALIEIWGLAGRTAPPQSVNWLILAATLMIASFRAWQQEHKLVGPLREVERRIWVNQSVRDLMSLRAGNIDIVTDKLVAPYLQKWLKVEGSVANVYDGYQSVVVRMEVPGSEDHFRDVSLVFSQDWKEHLNHLRKGDPFIAAGEITGIYASRIELRNCEVLSAADRVSSPTPKDQQYPTLDQSDPPPSQA